MGVKENTPTGRFLIAGVTAGAISQFTFHPLDVLKTRFQAQGRGTRNVQLGIQHLFKETIQYYKRDGILSFYRGLGPAMLGGATAWGLYFAIYNSLKHFHMEKHQTEDNVPPSISPQYIVLYSTVTGGTVSALTHPIWLLKTRSQLYQSQKKRSISAFRMAKDIYKHQGVRGFFVGLVPTLWNVSHGVIQFLVFEQLKERVMNDERETFELTPQESFFIGGTAKLSAVFCTYPIQVVKTRLQDVANETHQVRYKNMFNCLTTMVSQEGFKSLYRGILPMLVRLVPQASCTFMIFETLNNMLGRV
mmetsp:Transcript_10765/g.15752  ORF Transcript_10765/g.15752 Transcript_10765/m.15752 type:complete len:304 (-) Transcript_10765:1574-2485(-)